MMPGFRSQAHRAKLHALVTEGKFPQADFDALDAASPRDLPERATPTRKAGPPRLSTGGSLRYTAAAKQRLY